MGGRVEDRARDGDIVVLPLATPIGRLLIAAANDSLVRVELPRQDAEANLRVWLGLHLHVGGVRSGVTPILKKTAKQLEEYFTAGRTEFDLPLQMIGTDFQVAVWNKVAGVPFGTTLTYGEIATSMGNGPAFRAVGAAQAANPLPIVVPCHRIIGVGGKLTGYAGGLAIKKWLLQHEAGTPRKDRVGTRKRETGTTAHPPDPLAPPLAERPRQR